MALFSRTPNVANRSEQYGDPDVGAAHENVTI